MTAILSESLSIFYGLLGLLTAGAGIVGLAACLLLVLPSVVISRPYYWREGKAVWCMGLAGTVCLTLVCLWIVALGMAILHHFPLTRTG